MADFDKTFESIDASFRRIELTMFIGFIVLSSVWWAGVSGTATLILVSHQGTSEAAETLDADCGLKTGTQLALPAQHNCALDP
jgi:hypothetical protein